MNVTQIKALICTVLIFGSLGYYFVLSPMGYSLGNFDLPTLSLPDFGNNKPKSKNTKPTKSKSNKRSTVSGATISAPNAEGFGSVVDVLNGVNVYYNGRVTNVKGRNVTPDGYNLGLKYQCVEFVKRYYYEYFNHKMPDSYGHAKDFFDKRLFNGEYNRKRALSQYINGAGHKPQVNDLLIYGANEYNPYGHVAIVAYVSDKIVEVVQQNPGLGNPNRENYPLAKVNNRWKVMHKDVVGWLRKD